MYRIGNKSEEYRIKVSDHILDNIYGQIGITEVEKKIERLPIFKRLHDRDINAAINLREEAKRLLAV